MGVTFRSGDYIRRVFFGGRTIKDGEAAAIWNNQGQHRQIIGPRRLWIYSSTIRFLTRHKAEANQYLSISHRDGRVEFLRGPLSLYENPAFHDSVSVHDAIQLSSEKDCIIVTEANETQYIKKESTTSSKKNESDHILSSDKGLRRIVRGPTLYFPAVGEQIHEFSWSTIKDGVLIGKTCNFKVLNTASIRTLSLQIPLRTSDSFSFQAKISIQFHLSSLDECVLSTDPIAKMHTAILTDILPVRNSVTSEKLRSGEEAIVTHKLAVKETYPSLIKAAKICGFTIDGVSVIGLTFGQDLKLMIQKDHDLTVKLGIELADKKQELSLLELERENRRSAIEKEAELKRMQALLDEQLNKENDAIMEASLKRKLELTKLEMDINNEITKRYSDSVLSLLSELKSKEVDLTKFMCTQGVSLALPILNNSNPSKTAVNKSDCFKASNTESNKQE